MDPRRSLEHFKQAEVLLSRGAGETVRNCRKAPRTVAAWRPVDSFAEDCRRSLHAAFSDSVVPNYPLCAASTSEGGVELLTILSGKCECHAEVGENEPRAHGQFVEVVPISELRQLLGLARALWFRCPHGVRPTP